MKVAHCLSNFLPEYTAGTEVYTWALCKGLRAKGVDACVIIPNYHRSVNENYNIDGIQVHKYAEPSIVDKQLIMGLKISDGIGNFKTLLKDINPDIVHFHELSGSNGFTINHISAASEMGIKTMMTFHLAGYSCKASTLMYKNKVLCDGIIDELRCSKCMINNHISNPVIGQSVYSLCKILYKLNISLMGKNFRIASALSYPYIIKKLRNDLYKLVNCCNKIVVLTDWYYKILKDNNIDMTKVVLIKQGLAADIPKEITENNEKKPGMLRLVFLGRISKFKGLDLILDALEGLENNSIILDVFGSDPMDSYSNDCKSRIKRMPLVTWKGKLHTSEIISTIKNYDALILASTFSEMSPLVIQEAFAAKIPVIASDVYGNAEQIINNKNGWLFQFNDINELKKVLLRLVENPELINESKKNIHTGRSFGLVVDNYIQTYSTLN